MAKCEAHTPSTIALMPLLHFQLTQAWPDVLGSFGKVRCYESGRGGGGG